MWAALRESCPATTAVGSHIECSVEAVDRPSPSSSWMANGDRCIGEEARDVATDEATTRGLGADICPCRSPCLTAIVSPVIAVSKVLTTFSKSKSQSKSLSGERERGSWIDRVQNKS